MRHSQGRSVVVGPPKSTRVYKRAVWRLVLPNESFGHSSEALSFQVRPVSSARVIPLVHYHSVRSKWFDT